MFVACATVRCRACQRDCSQITQFLNCYCIIISRKKGGEEVNIATAHCPSYPRRSLTSQHPSAPARHHKRVGSPQAPSSKRHTDLRAPASPPHPSSPHPDRCTRCPPSQHRSTRPRSSRAPPAASSTPQSSSGTRYDTVPEAPRGPSGTAPWAVAAADAMRNSACAEEEDRVMTRCCS